MTFVPGTNQLVDWIYLKGDPNTEGSVRARWLNDTHEAEKLIDGLWCRMYDSDVQNSGYQSSTSGPVTTTQSQFIAVTGATTITLNASPKEGEQVKLKRLTTAGNVVVDGNGNTIDGQANYTMMVNYESITVVYHSTEGEWLIV